VSPLNEVDALHREVYRIDKMMSWGELTPDLLKMIEKAIARALKLKREGLL